MDVADIAFAAWRVDGEVGDHAPAYVLPLDKAREPVRGCAQG